MSRPAATITLVGVNLRPGLDGAATAMLELMPLVAPLGVRAVVLNFLTSEPWHRTLLQNRLQPRGAQVLEETPEYCHYREGEVDGHPWFPPFVLADLRQARAESGALRSPLTTPGLSRGISGAQGANLAAGPAARDRGRGKIQVLLGLELRLPGRTRAQWFFDPEFTGEFPVQKPIFLNTDVSFFKQNSPLSPGVRLLLV